MSNSFLLFSVLFIFASVHCDKLAGEIDLNDEHGFNATKYAKEYFLSPLPLSTIRSISYPIRQPNPFTSDPKANLLKPDMAYSKAYLHPYDSNTIKGLVQFRQLGMYIEYDLESICIDNVNIFSTIQSDMWFTEIKGIVEGLEPNSSYLLVVHQNPSTPVGRNLCNNQGQPLHYTPLQVDFSNVRERNALGDLGIISTDRNGVGAVNINTIYTSLFGGPGTIIGRSLGVYKLKGEKVILSPVHCGEIKMPIYAPAHFQNDPNATAIRKLSDTSSMTPTTSTTTTPVPDFEKPPFI